MAEELILKNAKIVTPFGVVEGCMHVRDEVIADIEAGPTSVAAIDCEGDYLIPGLIDLHTDNLERHLRPRQDAEWPVLAGVMAHDAEMVSVGITTIFDSLYVGGRLVGSEYNSNALEPAIRALECGQVFSAFRGDHFLHLRAETSREAMPGLFASVFPHPLVRLVSVMDHTPGQRQFANGARMSGRFGSFGQRERDPARPVRPENTMTMEERQQKYSTPNRAWLIETMKDHPVALASHDDATVEHVEQAHAEGIAISEFPTTIEAARTARQRGMKIVAGSPNLVLGRSRTGNVAAAELVANGLLDILASDYVPASLLYGVFLLSDKLAVPLPAAVATATLEPARMAGLDDRGSLEAGKRADLLRVGRADGIPFVRAAWRQGRRVA